MGILDRFSDIAKANINDALDRCEDPSKMIEQYLRELTDDLIEVKRETAGIMAEETRAKRLVDENAAQIARFAGLARKALAAGNEDDARVFRTKKQELEAEGADLAEIYGVAHGNASKMRQLHDKLVDDIEELNGRRALIEAKVAVAKTQDIVNEYEPRTEASTVARGAIDRMEDAADALLDQANAAAELGRAPLDAAAALEEKYAAARGNAAVEDELAKLKRDMGL